MFQIPTSAAVKQAFVNIAAAQTASVVVSAVTGKKIRVHAFVAQCGGTATDLTFNSNTSAISMKFANGANGGAVVPVNEYGWFETTAGQDLTATTGSGSTTGIQVLYSEA